MMVLFQPSAYLPGLDPDDRIISRRVADWTLEKFCPDRALFKRFVVALQWVLNHISQKLLASIAGANKRAAQDGFHFPQASLFFGAVDNWAAMNLWVPTRECRR